MPYFCSRCQVYGEGFSCWMCADHRVTFGVTAAEWSPGESRLFPNLIAGGVATERA